MMTSWDCVGQYARRAGNAGLTCLNGVCTRGQPRLPVDSLNFDAMRRPAVLLLMMFAMLWQSVAMARVGSSVNVLADLEHAALHWQAEAHHHHEDGSYHVDGSSESVQHVVTDHLSVSLEMAAPVPHVFGSIGSAVHGGVHETLVPNPTLDGLLRPPRPLS